MTTPNSDVIVSAGVDWITCTGKSEIAREKMREIAFALIAVESSLGEIGRPWFQSGYEGVGCGHVQYGERADSVIVRLGSSVAQGHWRRLYKVAENCSRLDLQVTVRTEQGPALRVHRHFRQIQKFRRQFRRAPKLARVTNEEEGYTVYSGRRCSDVMGRIYNKAAESNLEQFKGCVRYEVQYNGDRARGVAFAIVQGSLRLKDIALTTLQFFEERGAVLRSLIKGLSSTTLLKVLKCRAKKSDCQRLLEWLTVQVRPSVMTLLGRGLRAEVAFALGVP